MLNQFEGQAPSDPAVGQALAQVKSDTGTSINLVRTPERNLIRNSGQYWKALGLLGQSDGLIELTPFGHRVAAGDVTPFEFSVVTILTLTLPNPAVHNAAAWQAAGLTIRPLRLILEILVSLGEANEPTYLTPRELYEVVVPLAGVPGMASKVIAEAVVQRRSGALTLAGWPDCAKTDNDKRMAREFLLFLAHYGHLTRIYEEGTRDDERYYLHRNQLPATVEMLGLKIQALTEKQIDAIVAAPQIATVERQRRLTMALSRPQQQGFRNRVLRAASYKCAISGVDLPEVLEAAHIVSVANNGTDRTDNGLCLRSDLHALFDSGHLRLKPDGAILLTKAAALPINYGTVLPDTLTIPTYVDIANVAYRWKYQ